MGVKYLHHVGRARLLCVAWTGLFIAPHNDSRHYKSAIDYNVLSLSMILLPEEDSWDAKNLLYRTRVMYRAVLLGKLLAYKQQNVSGRRVPIWMNSMPCQKASQKW
jgi:hypothetical protein